MKILLRFLFPGQSHPTSAAYTVQDWHKLNLSCLCDLWYHQKNNICCNTLDMYLYLKYICWVKVTSLQINQSLSGNNARNNKVQRDVSPQKESKITNHPSPNIVTNVALSFHFTSSLTFFIYPFRLFTFTTLHIPSNPSLVAYDSILTGLWCNSVGSASCPESSISS